MTRRDLTFRVFVSSPFSDMNAERNVLQEQVFPKLRAHCQQKNARFQAIDMRWGVVEDAALDQQTMNICIRELQRCQELSSRPNFIALLGDRYGSRPLPSRIKAAELEALLVRLSEGEKHCILQWYRRDNNAVPPEYCLLPRTGDFVGRIHWAKEEDDLRTILLKATERHYGDNAPELQKYCDSATHQEIRRGVLEAKKPWDHVFCYLREIDGLPSDDSAKQYRDIHNGEVDTTAQSRLNLLKKELEALLPCEHVRRYRAVWQGDHPEWSLDRFCEDVRRDLQQIIDQEIAAFKQQPDLIREVEAHREFAEERCRHFVGRQDILHRIRDYLTSDEKTPLIIYGKSGSGKTALMAKAWLDLRQAKGLIGRFIGATPPSSDLHLLLTDLCRQMGIIDVPSDMNELVKTFKDRLSPTEQSRGEPKKRQPVVLFLDALDQLNPTDNARMLYWLPRELAPGVKLVMSVLQTECREEKPASRYDDCFDLANRIWPGHLIEIGPLDEDNGATLLDTWLTEAGRTLQPEQRSHVLGRFRMCPLPLYLKLAFEESRRWKSWEGVPRIADDKDGLSNSIEGILEDLLLRLEQPQNHGQFLVSHALGYIAAGKNGLTEDELLDALSNDKDAMADFHKRSPDSPKVDRLPVVIWSRLFADIEPYMTLRRADGTVVMDFYHRQVGKAVQRRYFVGDARVKAHQHLAEYFRREADPEGKGSWSECIRGLTELPYHLAASGQDKRLGELLSDIRYLDARCRICDIYALIRDYGLLLSSPRETPARGYEGFVRKHAQRLTKYRNLLFTLIHREGIPAAKAQAEELVQKGLWNRAWLSVTSKWMPSGSETGAAAFRMEVLSECEFDFSCATELSPNRLLAFWVPWVGQIEILDVSSGRKLTVAISTRTLSPVRLSCSSTGEYAAVAYVNGEVDLLRLRYAPDGDLLGQQELITLDYLVTELELPVLEFVGTTLWFQAADGSVMALDAAAAEPSPRMVFGVAGNDIGELSGVVSVGEFVVLSLRCGGDTNLMAIDAMGRTSSATIPNADVTCLTGMPAGRVAVACTDRRLVVHDASKSLKVICETIVGELPACMASSGDTLIWISHIGTLHVWQMGNSSGPSGLENSGRRLLGARRLAQQPDGTLAAVASASATCFAIVRAIRRSNHLQAVFLGLDGKCFAVEKRPSGLFLLDVANRAEVFLEPLHDWTHLFSMDGQGRLAVARNLGQGFLFEEGTFEPRLIQDIPPGITDISADLQGGFWLTDPWGAIYHLDQHGAFRKVGQVKFDGIGRSRIQNCPGLLIWSGKCLFQTPSGNEPLDVIVFFRLDERHPGKPELIDYRSFTAADGLLATVSYEPVRGSILTFWQHGDRHMQYAKVGSVQDFILHREKEVEINGADFNIASAVVTPDGRGIYLLCESGNLFRLHADTLGVQLVLSGSLPITDISPRAAEDGTVAIIEGKSRLLLCSLKGVSHGLP